VPQPKKSAASARRAASAKTKSRKSAAAAAAAAAPPPDETEDALRAGVAMLRDLLARGVIISVDLLQETVDEAVKRGRMTRDDAEELVANVLQIGRMQTQDAITELENLVERSATHTRRLARVRVERVASAARQAPGSDRALRAVDRARRAAGLGSPFPISGYDELTAAQIKSRLGELSPPELRKVRDHERRNANRKSVLATIEKQLA
jgi:polyhydroxyalkanoate synthesis regulator phasin